MKLKDQIIEEVGQLDDEQQFVCDVLEKYAETIRCNSKMMKKETK